MISRPDLRWKRCDIKSTNLLANVLAIEAARRAGCHEAVLIDSERVRNRGDTLVASLASERSSRGNAGGP